MFDKVNMTITRPGARPTPVSVPRLGLLRARERPDPRLSFFGADFSRFFFPPLTSVRNFFAGAASPRPGRCSHSRAPNFPACPTRVCVRVHYRERKRESARGLCAQVRSRNQTSMFHSCRRRSLTEPFLTDKTWERVSEREREKERAGERGRENQRSMCVCVSCSVTNKQSRQVREIEKIGERDKRLQSFNVFYGDSLQVFISLLQIVRVSACARVHVRV